MASVVLVDHRVKIKERPDLVLINKKKRTCHFEDSAVLVDHREKIKERPDQVLINKKKRTGHIVDFVVTVDHRVKIKERLDLVLINKKKRTYLEDFAVSAYLKVKMKQSKNIDKYFELWKKAEIAVEHYGDSYINCSWCTWSGLQRMRKETVETGNQTKNLDHPDHNAVKISWNT